MLKFRVSMLMKLLFYCYSYFCIIGTAGFEKLRGQVFAGNVYLLYQGSMASLVANMLGHYSWFFAHNVLDEKIPSLDGKINTVSRVDSFLL